jgi:hypothetical protein
LTRTERTIAEARRRLIYIKDHQASLRRLIAKEQEEDTRKSTQRIKEFSELLQKAEETKAELRDTLAQMDMGNIEP